MPLPDLSAQAVLHAILLYGPGLLLGITLHEAAHAYAARQCGDNTAYALGRVTLNPIKHIDPFGTVLLPLVMGLATAGGFIFGYAKPVPVNFDNLNNIKWDTVRVAAAGPAANLLIVLVCVLLLHGIVRLEVSTALTVLPIVVMAIKINLLLMVFNLLPLLPLDGGRIVHALLPAGPARAFAETERFGMLLILGLALTGILFAILQPVLLTLLRLVLKLAPMA
jgi:Zn-dependent protease